MMETAGDNERAMARHKEMMGRRSHPFLPTSLVFLLSSVSSSPPLAYLDPPPPPDILR